jgi:predicted DNA binding CopG/RHH family protein
MSYMENFKLLDKKITFRLTEDELNALERIKKTKSTNYSTIIRNTLRAIIEFVDEVETDKNNFKDNDYED